MYFPYLRGRQYELLGVREAIKTGIISEKIIPIIEPVKLSSTLFSTIKAAIKEEKEIAIICNSELGSFSDDLQSVEKTEEREEFLELLEDENIIKAFIIKDDWEEELDFYKEELDFEEEDIMIICNDANCIGEFEERYQDEKKYPEYILIPEEKRFRRKIKKNKVLLEDRFIREDRNSDYLKNEDDFFSEDHLYYKDDNYKGFSDYVTIGEKFSDGGFAPYAVAIHLTYIDEDDEDKPLRIHHFVSDSNDDIKDPAGKFYEAVRKVSEFDFPENSKTKALDRFIEYYEEEAYPGLGTVKKLSLLHHLELMENILNSGEN